MAITIIKQPQQLSPVYNPIIIALTSDNQAQSNFQFVADIFVRGNKVTTMKVPPNPDGFGVFDIQRHLENEISFDFNPTETGFNRSLKGGATYSVSFKEEWRYFYEFERVVNSGGFVGFASPGPSTGPGASPQPLFVNGDEINVELFDTTPLNPRYNGIATVTSVAQEIVNGVIKWVVRINKTIGTPQTNEFGRASLSNFRLSTFGSTVSVTQRDVFNGVLDFYDELNWNYLNYEVYSGTNKFLTSVPNGYSMLEEDNMWLQFYQNTTAVDKVRIISATGSFYYIDNTYQNLNNGLDKLLRVGVGPKQILSITGPTSYYTITLIDDEGNELTEQLRFNVKKGCSRYEKIQLVFLDKLGSFIPFTFNMVNKHNRSLTRSNYQQNYGRYAPAQQNWTYKSWDRGKKSLDTIVTETYTINSDWVDQKTSDLLMVLVDSPVVYWVKEDGTVFGINLTVNSVERKQVINDQIINYTMTFELSNKSAKQRG